MEIYKYIEGLKEKLPDLCTDKDLIEAGIFLSMQQACLSRKKKKCPSYIQYPSKRIVYPKEAVLQYVENSLVICK